MKTILHVVGNRPQFIKLAVLHKTLAAAGIPQEIIHSGQHFGNEMSDIFFERLHIPAPGIHLSADSSQPDLFIGNIASSLQQYLAARNGDDIVLVYGDTNTSLAAALAASRTGRPLLHVEAGIRTLDKSMPEEINRILTDRMADTNYCCTAKNRETLLSEGFESCIPSRIVLTGDLMYDAFLTIPAAAENAVSFTGYVACTIHRAANILSKDNLSAIIQALNTIHRQRPVVMPVHPHTAKRIKEYGLEPAFTMLPPLGYAETKRFLKDAVFVITDSGGMAREAFFSKKRSVVVMNKPFWPEIIEHHASISSSADQETLLNAYAHLSTLDPAFDAAVFGNGSAAEAIKNDIEKNLL